MTTTQGRIAAIETLYKGYRFRSRLEARWAVFFDAMGLEWEYEPEGYNLGEAGYYLPDFFIKITYPSRYAGAGYWLEVKGQSPTVKERLMFRELCHLTGHCGFMATSIPGDNPLHKFYRHRRSLDEWRNALKARRFTRPILDGSAALKMYDAGARLALMAGSRLLDDGEKTTAYELFVKACRAARSARFEHGECGAGA